ncbi:MAG: YwaF family protein [Clostridia bacterium]|nr:YwaF family protein [Clostridia bacterium]
MGLWTELHFYTVIPAFIVFIIVAVFMGKALKDKSEKAKYLPLQIITVILLVLELAKQVIHIINGYDMYALPFHYCSLFLYLLPLHSFYRGKHKQTVDTATFGCCSSLFFFMLVMPAIVYGDGNIKEFFDIFAFSGGSMGEFTSAFLSFHTVVFHNLVCLYFLLMVALKMYEMNTKRDLKVLGVFLGYYVVIAALLANVLQVNFHNLYRCNLGFVEELRQAMIAQIGTVGHLIYLVALFVLTILFAYAAYFTVKGVLWLINKIASKLKKEKPTEVKTED